MTAIFAGKTFLVKVVLGKIKPLEVPDRRRVTKYAKSNWVEKINEQPYEAIYWQLPITQNEGPCTVLQQEKK